MADSDGEDDSDLSGYKVPLGAFDDVELGGLPPIAPDGGFAPGPVGTAPSVPAATADNFVCLRGPCIHYWQLETFFASGNPKETWGEDGLKNADGSPVRMPRQISRSCLAHPGTETELTDDAVYFCSRWEPMTAREAKARAKRIAKYFKNYPEHRPKE